MQLLETTKLLNDFFGKITNSFIEDCVPISQTFPYLTYSLNIQEFSREGILQVRIWDESSSVNNIIELGDKLEQLIGENGVILQGEQGYIWLYKGIPFMQIEPTYEDKIKSIYILLRYRNM